MEFPLQKQRVVVFRIYTLLLFGKKYSYNNIYVFQKTGNNATTAIPIDVKASKWVEFDMSLVVTSSEYTDMDYTFTILIKDRFLQDNGLSKYLYMGLFTVDCSPEKKAKLILADTYSE